MARSGQAMILGLATGREVETGADAVTAVAHGTGAVLVTGQASAVAAALGQAAADARHRAQRPRRRRARPPSPSSASAARSTSARTRAFSAPKAQPDRTSCRDSGARQPRRNRPCFQHRDRPFMLRCGTSRPATVLPDVLV